MVHNGPSRLAEDPAADFFHSLLRPPCAELVALLNWKTFQQHSQLSLSVRKSLFQNVNENDFCWNRIFRKLGSQK